MSNPKRYQINDIRSKFQTVALSNYYQVFFETNSLILQAAARRGIDSRFITEDLGLYISDAVLPGSSFADIEVAGDRQGITERFPQNRIYDDVTFSFYVDRGYNVVKFFETWIDVINPLKDGGGSSAINPDVMRLTYPNLYKCNISLHKFNKDYFSEPRDNFNPFKYIIEYTFLNAWPYSVASTPVSYSGSNILQLNVTFRYDRYTVEGITIPTPLVQPIPLSSTSSLTPPDTAGGQDLRPISGSAAGQPGVVFYDANTDTSTSAIVNGRFYDQAGNPI